MEINFNPDELKKRIEEKLGTGPYLGNYNPEQRRAAVFAKLHEYFDECNEAKQNKDDDSTTDPVERKVIGLLKKVKSLEAAVEKFSGPHFNLEFRKLNENCINYQIELNFTCTDEALNQKRRMALTDLNSISERLYAKIHKGEKCDKCS